jgi:erythromycin esterase-like protein
MRERAEELSKAHRSLVNTISEFSAFTARFVELFDSMEADLGELSSLAEQIDGIRNKLGSLEAHAEKRINEILARRSENEWKIGNDRLRTIIDRFTIFAHKQTAGELGGFEVESGAQSGEVTLF